VYANISTPKYIQTAAMCTFAESVGFSLGNRTYTFPGGMDVILMEGTGIAIDDNHILSTAHVFEWPVGRLGPAPAGSQISVYLHLSYMLISLEFASAMITKIHSQGCEC
jgi:hypothetical protein